MVKLKGILIFILLFHFILAKSKENPLTRHYTVNDGLPSSTIFPPMEDKDGFIWFGTDVGVTRFDGNVFQNFTISDGLSDNFILNVKSDSKGRIWFLGFNGTVSYWLNGKIFNETSDTLLKHIKSRNSFVDFFEDNQQRLWFISISEYLILENYKVERIGREILYHPGIVFNCLQGQAILSPLDNSNYIFSNRAFNKLKISYNFKKESGYLRLKDGGILFIAKEGLIKQVDTNQELLIPIHWDINSTRMGSLTLADDSIIYITEMGKGVWRYDLKTPTKDPDLYLEDKNCVGVLSDHEGNIWVATKGHGLFMFPKVGKNVVLFTKENILRKNECYVIAKDILGQYIIGQNEERLILTSNNLTNELKFPISVLNYNQMYKIMVSGDNICLASDEGLLHVNLKTGCNHYLQYVLSSTGLIARLAGVKDFSISGRYVYMALGNKLFSYELNCRNNNNQHLATEIVRDGDEIRNYSIYLGNFNQLWYGSIDGLKMIKDSSVYDQSNANVLLKQRINSIGETEDSTLVLGSHGSGVIFYRNGTVILQVTKEQGLCNDICRRVFIRKDQIFVTTPSGVSVLFYKDGKVESIKNITKGNFLPSNDVNDVYADDKEIAIATSEGVAVISQIELEKSEKNIPKLSFKSILVENSSLEISKYIELPYNQNSFKFDFVGIYYQQPDAVNYRYRLVENQPWQATKNNRLEFPFLGSGEYNLEIQARIEDGDWSNSIFYRFTINPPFWKTYWFSIIILVVLFLLSYMLIRLLLNRRRKQYEQKLKIEKQVALLEQQALQTMMNPHFIFNVMNSIQHFINADNKEAANNYLVDFATLIRLNLSLSYQRFIPLEDEISYLELYLKFEKLRMGDLFTYEIIIDPSIDTSETTIAVMMIQPFIENGVWHGISPLVHGGHISVEFRKASESSLQIIISDNGVGISENFIKNANEDNRDGSHALQMTRQRLKLLGKTSDQELYLRFSHLKPDGLYKGTKVELLISTDQF